GAGGGVRGAGGAAAGSRAGADCRAVRRAPAARPPAGGAPPGARRSAPLCPYRRAAGHHRPRAQLVGTPARMAARRGRAGARGMTLASDVWGAGPPLVLLHGFTGSIDTWEPVRTLLGSRHRVVAVDLPRHGPPPPPPPPSPPPHP